MKKKSRGAPENDNIPRHIGYIIQGVPPAEDLPIEISSEIMRIFKFRFFCKNYRDNQYKYFLF